MVVIVAAIILVEKIEIVVDVVIWVVVDILAEVVVEVVVVVVAEVVLVMHVLSIVLVLGHSAIERFTWYMDWVSIGALTCKWCKLIQTTSILIAVWLVTHRAL